MVDVDKVFLGGGLFGVFVGLAITGFALGSANKYWRAECIKRNIAEYNQSTGVWQWKETQTESK